MNEADVTELDHKVTVRLTYTNGGYTPYKWMYRCRCGAGGASWQWRREEESSDPYVSGALAMAIHHVGLLPAELDPYER